MMKKPTGSKEAAVRAMRETKAEDDLSIPPFLVRKDDGKRRKAKPERNGDAGVSLAPPLATQKAIARDLRDGPLVGTVASSTLAETGTFDVRTNLAAQAAKDAKAKRAAAKAEPEDKPKAETTKEKTAMKTNLKAKAAPAAKRAATKTGSARRKIEKHPAQRKGTVSGQAVADMMARKGGASMKELTAAFKMDAHPMRSKVYFARHTLGYKVEHRDGRYYATAPKAKK